MKKLSFRTVLTIIALFIMVFEARYQYKSYFKFKNNLRSENAIHSSSIPVSGTVNYHGIDYSVEKPSGVKRILILGGSAAEGHGTKLRNSWGGILAAELHKTYEPRFKIEMINMAQGAATSIDDYLKFVQEGHILKPDLVIVYSGWNDIAAFTGNPGWIVRNTDSRLSEIGKSTENYNLFLLLKRRSYWFRKYFQWKEFFERFMSLFYGKLEALRNDLWSFLFNTYFKHSKLFNYLSGTASVQQQSVKSFSEIMKENNIRANYFDDYQRINPHLRPLYMTYFRNNLTQLAKAFQDSRTPAVFIFQPDLAHQKSHRVFTSEEDVVVHRLLGPKTDIWFKICHDYYPIGIQIMKEVADSFGIPFLNMDNMIQSERAEKIFFDNVHYTDEGNKLIGSKIFNFIKQNHLLEWSD